MDKFLNQMSYKTKMYPSAYFLAQGLIAEKEGRGNLSAITTELAERNLDLKKITIRDGSFYDLFHPTASYTLISRAGETSTNLPDVFFISSLNVKGSRKGSFGPVHFSAQVTYNSECRDLREDHGFWEEIISPELKALETYLSARGKVETIYTYRSVKEVKR